MRTIGNILWLPLSGIWLALTYLFAGTLACLAVVTIPWGIACFRIAAYALWPFGRAIVRGPHAGTITLLGNIVWFILGSWYTVLVHVVTGTILCVTIVGIPWGLGNFAMIPVAFAPLGKTIVSARAANGPPRVQI